jgi:DNA (cytosine-5)-methyltransferase 1
MKYFSMFSGIGGFELGIERAYSNKQLTQVEQDRQGRNGDADEAGGNVLSTGGCAPLCIGFSEVNKYAVQCYESHFGHKNYGDATRIVPEELPDFDFLCGGFPCQAFSIAGKRGGFKDTRGTLFFEIARILSVKRPQLLLLENVKGLLSHDRGRTFGTILATLSELGYLCEWQVLNSKDFGVPQNRERVFIVGHLGGTGGGEVFPIGKINDRLYEQTEDIQSEVLSDQERGNIAYIDQSLLQNGSNRPLRIRRLTPTECERLQGFPDGWTAMLSDSQRYKCLGNAVTVNVIEAIMNKLLNRNI